jgi:uncharacterized membrane protein
MKEVPPEQFIAPSPSLLKGYAVAAIGALLVYVPWAAILFLQFVWRRRPSLNWLDAPTTALTLILHWIANIGTTIFDFDAPSGFERASMPSGIIAHECISAALLLLFAYALYTLIRRTPRRTWLFVVVIAAVFTLPQFALDFLKGGLRSTIPRYALPLFVTMTLSIAWLLADRITAPRAASWAWRTLTGLILAGGVASLVVSSRADYWWNKGSDAYLHVAQVIRSSSNPVLISPLEVSNTCQLLTFCHEIPPTTRIRAVFRKTDIPDLDDLTGDIFFFNPSPSQIHALKSKQYGFAIVDPDAPLWRVTTPAEAINPK